MVAPRCNHWHATADRTGANAQGGREKPRAEKPDAEKPDAEKPGAEKPGAEKLCPHLIRGFGVRPTLGYAWPATPDSCSGSTFSLAKARRHFVSCPDPNISVSSAGTDSQAFCWISLSSWPGPQPA